MEIIKSGDNLDNLKLEKINNKKLNILNNNKKIWLETPKLKFVKIFPATWMANISVQLDSCPDFINSIKNLENKISEIIQKNNPELKLKSGINNQVFYYQLPYIHKIPENKIGEFNFPIFDENNQKINSINFTSGLFIKSFLELSYIWINQFNFGLNWNTQQLKIYPEICLFSDGIPKKIPGPPPPPPEINSNININKLAMPGIKPFVPSITELLAVKNKLKKINRKKRKKNRKNLI